MALPVLELDADLESMTEAEAMDWADRQIQTCNEYIRVADEAAGKMMDENIKSQILGLQESIKEMISIFEEYKTQLFGVEILRQRLDRAM